MRWMASFSHPLSLSPMILKLNRNGELWPELIEVEEEKQERTSLWVTHTHTHTHTLLPELIDNMGKRDLWHEQMQEILTWKHCNHVKAELKKIFKILSKLIGFKEKGNVSLKPHATDQTQERKLHGEGKACRFLWTTPFSSSIIIVKQLWETHINFL